MFIYPTIAILLFPLFPESPYFLLNKKNDPDAARAALYKLYGKNKHETVEAQLTRMQQSIKTAESLMHTTRTGSFWQVFQGQNFKRTLAAFLVSGSQQFCGVIFVVGYVPYFLTLVGFTNVFNWSMYLFTINLLANIAR